LGADFICWWCTPHVAYVIILVDVCPRGDINWEVWGRCVLHVGAIVIWGGAKLPKFGGFYGVGAAEKKGRANVSVAHHPFYTL
jgi:hypothetical protein